MAKILLLLGLSVVTQTYVLAFTSAADLVQLGAGNASFNLTSILQKDWNQHFQNKIDLINRLLELKHGSIGLFRSIYTTDNIRFFRNLIGFGVKIGNISLENLPDEALSPSELLSRGVSRLLVRLSPPPNQETLENHSFEDESSKDFETQDSGVIENQTPPVFFQAEIENLDATPNFNSSNLVDQPEIDKTNGTPHYEEENDVRLIRSVDKNKDAEELLKKYKENEALLKEYEDRVVALDKLIRSA